MNKITHISSKRASFSTYLKKVWSYRHLILVLTRRDLKAKYAQTFLGVFWSVVQPLISLLIFVFFFEYVVNVSDQIQYSYAVFAFSGMLCWNYFSFMVNSGGLALMESQELIQKIYFPKIIPLLAKILTGLADLGTSLIILSVLMLWKGILPPARILILPVFFILLILVAAAVGIWLNSLTVKYRDFHHLIPYLINFSIWLTPVFYPSTLLPEQFSYLLYCNPVAGVIEGVRWCLIPQTTYSWYYLPALIFMGMLFVVGIRYLIRIEDQISDIL